MDSDVRFERDIYTWLTSMHLSQYYFLFKAQGYEKIRDILYATEDDMLRMGITDPVDVVKIMLGIRHVSVPDSMAVDPAYHVIFQCGRIIVEIFKFCNYRDLVSATAVCKGWDHALVTGVKELKIERPARFHAPLPEIFMRFRGVLRLSGTQFGPDGALGLKAGVVGLIDKTDLGSQLRQLDLSSNALTVDGTEHICEAMQLGAMTHLESLNLAYNAIRPLGLRMFSRALCFKRHRTLKLLDLSGNPLSDKGVKELAGAFEAEAVPHLVELRLGSVIMGNAGAKALATTLANKALPRLRALDMRYNMNVKDAGGAHLLLAVQVNGMPELGFLCLKGHGMGRSLCLKFLRAADGLFDVVV